MTHMLKGVFLTGIFFVAQDEQAVEEALRGFRKAYAHPNPSNRAAAVGELARTPHERTLKTIGSLLSGEVKEVRIAAARALAHFADYKKRATPLLLAALEAGSAEPDVQVAILEALGKLQDETALPTVHQQFRGRHIKVAKAAVATAGAIKGGASLQAMLELSRDIRKWLMNNQGGGYKDDAGVGDDRAQRARLVELQAEIMKSFASITGEKWTTLEEWEIWVRRHGSTLKPTR